MLRLIFALSMLVTVARAQPFTGALGPQPGPGDPAGAATAAVNAAIPATIGVTAPACGAGVAGGPLAACGASTVLPTGTTIVTPAAGDNSTSIATTAFVAPAFAPQFGTGADGTVTISSGTVTITRDMHYTNLTISGTGKLTANGFRVFVSNILDISAAGASAINLSPVNGLSATSSAGAATTTTSATARVTSLFQSTYSYAVTGAGGSSSITTGSNGSVSVNIAYADGGWSGASGAGGAGVSAGGTAVAAGLAGQFENPVLFPEFILNPVWYDQSMSIYPVGGGAWGPGGSGGGGDGVNSGGGGGGGGQAGGVLWLAAKIIARGTNTTAGIFSNKGAPGGSGFTTTTGNTGGGGGAGGAGGGMFYMITQKLTGSVIPNAIDLSGGAGGAGGSGFGTGKGGNGGGGGNGGNAQLIVLSQTGATTGIANGGTLSAAGYNSSVGNLTGTAGSTTSTSTGAAGGAGATMQVGL